MNYSAKAKRLHDIVSASPGKLLSDLQKWDGDKTVQRLVSAGILRLEVIPGRRGNPKRVFAGIAPPQSRKLPIKSTASKSPAQDKIVAFLAERGEATIGQIAAHLKKPSSSISTTLLSMATSGKVVRRRVLGKISGRTQSCEWYAYRLP